MFTRKNSKNSPIFNIYPNYTIYVEWDKSSWVLIFQTSSTNLSHKNIELVYSTPKTKLLHINTQWSSPNFAFNMKQIWVN